MAIKSTLSCYFFIASAILVTFSSAEIGSDSEIMQLLQSQVRAETFFFPISQPLRILDAPKSGQYAGTVGGKGSPIGAKGGGIDSAAYETESSRIRWRTCGADAAQLQRSLRDRPQPQRFFPH